MTVHATGSSVPTGDADAAAPVRGRVPRITEPASVAERCACCGSYFESIGTDQRAARKSGVSVERTEIMAFTACGVFAGEGALHLMSRLGAADAIGEATTSARFSTRLNSFALGKGKKLPSGDESTVDLIAIAGTVQGLTALELNYPEHFTDPVDDIRAALDRAGLANLGVQLRWPTPTFSGGAFTSPDPLIRAQAVALVLEAVEMGRALGSTHVLLWPAHDGYEYPLQMDYVLAWSWLIESLVEVTDYAPDMRFSIEYKPAEPRGRTMLNTTGAVMKLIADVARPNLGVTLDFGHLLMARESPGQSAALALRDRKLFGIQLNDSHAAADDGLLVGSVHLPETLELAYYLVREGYDGTFYFDTDPVREDPVRECELNIRRMTTILAIAQKLVDAHPDLPHGDALMSADTTWTMLLGGSMS